MLTDRQEQIVEMRASGMSNTQIAKNLGLSESTVSEHLRVSCEVLGADNIRDLPVVFIKQKIAELVEESEIDETFRGALLQMRGVETVEELSGNDNLLHILDFIRKVLKALEANDREPPRKS